MPSSDAIRARNSVRTAIESGRLKHPTLRRCVSCNRQASLYHHTDGYQGIAGTKVVPMCRKCHGRVHYGRPVEKPDRVGAFALFSIPVSEDVFREVERQARVNHISPANQAALLLDRCVREAAA